jgi:hypothetical protein
MGKLGEIRVVNGSLKVVVPARAAGIFSLKR